MALDDKPQSNIERWTDGGDYHQFAVPADEAARALARRIMAGEQPTPAELGLAERGDDADAAENKPS